MKENHDVNLEQANMFRDLRKILAFKLKVLRTEVSGEMEEGGVKDKRDGGRRRQMFLTMM